MGSYDSTIVAVFDLSSDARSAISEMRDANFREDQMGLIVRDREDRPTVTADGEDESKVAEGAIAGGITGAGIGSLWALGIAAGVLPVIGPVVAGGLLASVLASAAGGAAVGGLAGALIGLGVSEEDARFYESEFQAGKTLVTVQPNDRLNEAMAILRRHGAAIRSCTAGTSTRIATTSTQPYAKSQPTAMSDFPQHTR